MRDRKVRCGNEGEVRHGKESYDLERERRS
jgi:hypothetical protein